MLNKTTNIEYKILKLNFEADSNNYVNEYDSFLNSIYGLQYTNGNENNYFSFGIITKCDRTDFYVVVPNDYVNFFKKKYAIVNPLIEFDEIEDPLIDFSNTLQNNKCYCFEGYNMKLRYEDSNKKLKTQGADKNFLKNLLNSMDNLNTEDTSIIEISIKPLNYMKNNSVEGFKFPTEKVLTKGLMGLGNLTAKSISAILDETVMNGQMSKMYKTNNSDDDKHNKENKKVKSEEYSLCPQFLTQIKLISKSNNPKNVLDNIKAMSSTFVDLSSSNSLIPTKIRYEDMIKRNMKNLNILTTSEITQFLHLPDNNVVSENVETCNYKKIYDHNIPNTGIIFGTSNNNNIAFPAVPLSVKEYEKRYKEIQNIVDNLSKPKLVLGQQGTGKSEWVINYVIALAKMHISAIVIDPKNDTQQRLIESMPDDLLENLVYFNLGDLEFPPAFNIFRKRKENDPTENALIVTSFISLMKKETRNWGFKMERTCQMTAEAILLNDTCTLNEFELMLTERIYRESMISKMKCLLNDDEYKGKSHIRKLLKYWENYNEMDDRTIWKDIEPVMNVVGPFLSNRIIKAVVSQTESFDFRKAADEGKIVIINIPEGILRENTKLLASMINKSIWLDIQSRADVDISKRYPVAWVIDEAHEIVDDEFVSVLTKARAYRLGLTLVTQGLSNFKMRGMDDIRELIMTNCKNKIIFRLGFADAREIAEEFSPLTYLDINNCPDRHFYSKMLLDNGTVSNAFFSEALYKAEKLRNYDEFVKKHRSGKLTVDEIEDEIDERLESVKMLNNLSSAI